MSEPLVPVHVIAGFLGTGKTTALQHLLRRRGPSERIAVVVNDFGEASLDATLLEQLGGTAGGPKVQEIPGGCICCTAPAGFSVALTELLDQQRPDRILVEPTGLARPQDLVDTLRRGPGADRLAVRPLVVLVDPTRLDGHPLLRQQAEAADFLVANRTDLADEASMEAFRAWAEGLWPGPAATFEVSHGRLPDAVLDWPEDTGPRAERFSIAAAAPSTDGFFARSLTWALDEQFSRERLRAALETSAELPVARLKGVFHTDDGAWLLELAGGRVHEAPSPYRRDSRVDVIVQATGDAAHDAVEAVVDALSAALLTEAERRVDPERIELVRPDGTRTTVDRSAVLALPDQVGDLTVLLPKRAGRAAPLRHLLARVGISDDTEAVVVAADGFASQPVPTSALGTAVLQHSTPGGAALGPDQGGPFRLLIPGDAGPGGPCANVKGVVRMVFRPAGA